MTLAFGRREFLGGVAAAGLLSGCKVSNVPGKGDAASGDLAKQLQGMADQMLAEYPENSTILGIATGANEPLNHRLTDRTLAGVAARADGARKRLATLKELDLSDLGKPANLDAAVALAGHELADEGFRFPFGDAIVLDPNIGFRNTPYVVNQLGGAFVDVPDFLNSRHTVGNEQEAVAYADRVDDYARNLDGETERLAHDRAAGVVAPDFTLRQGIAGAATAVGRAEEASGGGHIRRRRVALQGRRILLRLGAEGRHDHDPLTGRDPPAWPGTGQGGPGPHGIDHGQAGHDRRHGR
jgi:uncharacterized protein (DUF885 family)